MSRSEEIILSVEAVSRTGLAFDKVGPNQASIRMPLQGNANHNGIMYAGSLFSLAEAAPGVLILNRFDPAIIAPICASVNIRFRRPAQSDVSLHINISDKQFEDLKNEVMTKDKASIDFTQELLDTQGEVVSIAEVKYVLLKT